MQTRSKAIEIIPNRLYWISDVSPPKNIPNSFYFNIDKDLVYEPFYMDFGPLNLAKTYKYVSELEKLLENPEYKKNHIYHHTSTAQDKMANSAYLICAFQVIILGYSPQQAYESFKHLQLVPFRDASYGQCSYKCTLLDCLGGLDYAMNLNWFCYKKFNLLEYEHYERVENGDLNWIIPGKFVAFSSPTEKSKDRFGNRQFTPADYVPIFNKIGVTMVIRLNNKTYEASEFIKEGIKHHDLFFTDGTAPDPTILNKFLEIVQNQPGAIAVHCKAGLGRTGTLIGCYAMKHYYFPAAQFIGWIRIARPGSILGPQQYFLIEQERAMRQRSKDSSIWRDIQDKMVQNEALVRLKTMSLHTSTSPNNREIAVMLSGDKGQGQGLVEAKIRRQHNKKEDTEGRDMGNIKTSGSKGSNGKNGDSHRK